MKEIFSSRYMCFYKNESHYVAVWLHSNTQLLSAGVTFQLPLRLAFFSQTAISCCIGCFLSNIKSGDVSSCCSAPHHSLFLKQLKIAAFIIS